MTRLTAPSALLREVRRNLAIPEPRTSRQLREIRISPLRALAQTPSRSRSMQAAFGVDTYTSTKD